MSFIVKLHPNVVKFLNNLDKDTKIRIISTIRNLENDTVKSRSKADIKILKGTKGRHNLYRLRIGDYRVIYSIEDDTLWVTEIFGREKGYKWL